MAKKTERILDLLDSTSYNYREIANIVGCTQRMVRHVGGPQKKRNKKIQKVIDSQLPKILTFDIETSPMEFYGWGLYKQQPSIANIKKDWSVLSWAAKWLFQPEPMHMKVSPEEAHNREDRSVLQGIWDLLDEADIIIAHNGKKFDTRKLNARFWKYDMLPPSPYQIIDTMRECMKIMSPASYKLKYLAKYKDLDQKKEDTDYDWWIQCVDGTHESALHHLDLMDKYCVQDVFTLEDLYMDLRPWIKSHPNVAGYVETDRPICPTCGNLKLHYVGDYMTQAGQYKSFRCKKNVRGCGAIGRQRTSANTAWTKPNQLRSVAR